MGKLRVGFIGVGKPWRSPGASGFGMAHAHAEGYKKSADVEIVSIADINLDNARAFQAAHGGESVFADYREMLQKERLDIVSISTWPHLHGEMVIACAEAGVKAVHCEKPISPSYDEARRMVKICKEKGVQLTFNHQRRFDAEFRKAKELLNSGRIGKLLRLEAACPDLYDWGTHWFDMLFFYNNETPVEWVMGQAEHRNPKIVFGVPMDTQGLSHYRFTNGVSATIYTSSSQDFVGYNRLFGEEGMIELDMRRKPQVRVWGKGMDAWEDVPTEQVEAVHLGVLDLIDALQNGREPELSARKALAATELIFATYESSRRRGRVDLPLTVEGLSMDALFPR